MPVNLNIDRFAKLRLYLINPVSAMYMVADTGVYDAAPARLFSMAIMFPLREHSSMVCSVTTKYVEIVAAQVTQQESPELSESLPPILVYFPDMINRNHFISEQCKGPDDDVCTQN